MNVETYLKMSSVASIITSLAVVAFVIQGSNYMTSTTLNRSIWYDHELSARQHRCSVAKKLGITPVEADQCGRVDP